MKHGIIVPCYNESEQLNIDAYINFLKDSKDHEVCFVNDGSNDNTLATLNLIRRSANTDNVYIYNLEKNEGKAEAIRQGALFLHSQTPVDTIGFMDASLSTSFSDYSQLCHTLEKSEGDLKLVFGARGADKQETSRNPIESAISLSTKTLIPAITKVQVSDVHCGAKVFSREIIPIIFNQSFVSQKLFDVEIILRLKNKRGQQKLAKEFQEQTLKSYVDIGGSKPKMKETLMTPFNLLSLWSNYVIKPAIWTVSQLPNAIARKLLFSENAGNQWGSKMVKFDPYRNLDRVA